MTLTQIFWETLSFSSLYLRNLCLSLSECCRNVWVKKKRWLRFIESKTRTLSSEQFETSLGFFLCCGRGQFVVTDFVWWNYTAYTFTDLLQTHTHTHARTKKEAQTTRAGRKDSSRYSLCSGESVLLSRWLYSLCQCPLLSSLSDPARCSACLVTGRPVWGCNNPAPSAHAPDSMLLKVHYK